MGVALFAIVFMVFFLLQSGVFVAQVIAMSPEFAGRSPFGLLEDSDFRVRMNELLHHGDVVANQALWSGLLGSLALVGSVYLWKRRRSVDFLGLRPAPVKRYLPWLGLFVLMALVIEGLAHLSPAFDTDFMERVLGTSTKPWLLLLGVGVMAPLFEELLLRGLLLGSLRYMADEHAAVAITAGVFALMHLQYDWTVILLILPMGIILGYARTRSGSIWVPVLLHVLNNSLSVVLG